MCCVVLCCWVQVSMSSQSRPDGPRQQCRGKDSIDRSIDGSFRGSIGKTHPTRNIRAPTECRVVLRARCSATIASNEPSIFICCTTIIYDHRHRSNRNKRQFPSDRLESLISFSIPGERLVVGRWWQRWIPYRRRRRRRRRHCCRGCRCHRNGLHHRMHQNREVEERRQSPCRRSISRPHTPQRASEETPQAPSRLRRRRRRRAAGTRTKRAGGSIRADGSGRFVPAETPVVSPTSPSTGGRIEGKTAPRPPFPFRSRHHHRSRQCRGGSSNKGTTPLIRGGGGGDVLFGVRKTRSGGPRCKTNRPLRRLVSSRRVGSARRFWFRLCPQRRRRFPPRPIPTAPSTGRLDRSFHWCVPCSCLQPKDSCVCRSCCWSWTGRRPSARYSIQSLVLVSISFDGGASRVDGQPVGDPRTKQTTTATTTTTKISPRNLMPSLSC